jgi:plasmid maintenance system antidote protein VapI
MQEQPNIFKVWWKMLEPFMYGSHPGVTLLECLLYQFVKPLDLSIVDEIKLILVLENIIKEKPEAKIDDDTADVLEKLLCVRKEFWLALQHNCDEANKI